MTGAGGHEDPWAGPAGPVHPFPARVPPLPWAPPAAPAGPGRPAGSSPRLALVVGLLAGVVGASIGGGVVAAVDRRDGTTATVASRADPTITRSAPVTGPAPSAASVPAIAAAVLPSVVTIEASAGSTEDTGSGVVLNSSGYILTNNHVVADVATSGGAGSRLQVIPDGGSSADALTATVVGTDPLTDLAVIRVSGAHAALKPAVLGHSNGLRIGDTVLAVGAPLGLDGTVTQGIVSATNRFFTVGGDDCSAGTAYAGAIQTDAAINPGNSGGALVDDTGAVVGINSAIATAPDSSSSSQGGNIGVGFAIPIDEAAPTAQDIISTGHAAHPFLGVSTVDSGHPAGAKVTTTQDPCGGGTIPGVQPGSPAARAGLVDGDVITAIGGTAVQASDDLVTQIRLLRVGDTVTVTYTRGGHSHTVSVTLVERPSS